MKIILKDNEGMAIETDHGYIMVDMTLKRTNITVMKKTDKKFYHEFAGEGVTISIKD